MTNAELNHTSIKNKKHVPTYRKINFGPDDGLINKKVTITLILIQVISHSHVAYPL